MSRPRRTSLVLLTVLVTGLGALSAGLPGGMGIARAGAALPSMNAPELGQGAYAAMHMLLQKTLLKINVATIDVRIDKAAQTKLAALATGKTYSSGLDQQLGPVITGASHALVVMEFKRDIGLNRWIGVVRDNLEEARKAGLITPVLEKRVSDGLPQWFASMNDRGYLKGDRLYYAVAPDSLRTVVASAGGQVVLERMDNEREARNVVLATYFAPGSEFREPLLRSLVEGK